jgi:hypothetical protein
MSWLPVLAGVSLRPPEMLERYQAEDCPYCEGVRETRLELGVS